MNRRNILIGLGTVAVVAAGGGAYWLTRPQTPSPSAPQSTGAGTGSAATASASGPMQIHDDDRILGDPAAPVTILEYSSLTCPHCASFHKNTLPQVEADWIESGRARLVYRHYPLDQLALRAAAVADCIQGDGFFGFLDVLFANQEKWAHSEDPLTPLRQYAALAGLDGQTFDACLNDEAAIDRILARQAEGRDQYNVASTPSFVINGTPVVGARSYDEFNQVLESAAAQSS